MNLCVGSAFDSKRCQCGIEEALAPKTVSIHPLVEVRGGLLIRQAMNDFDRIPPRSEGYGFLPLHSADDEEKNHSLSVSPRVNQWFNC